MPYQIISVGNGEYAVINRVTGAVHAKATSLAKAKAQVRLLGATHERFRGGGTIPKTDEIYLLLSEEAYRPRTARRAEIEGYRYDLPLSTERTAVYASPTARRVIVAHRGTVPSDKSDLRQDALIALGQFDRSDRLKRALKTVEEVRRKYAGYAMDQTGHSLGGRVAAEIGKAIGGKVVTFNLGGSPADIASSLKDRALCSVSDGTLCQRLKMQTHYSTGVDPVSFTSALLHGSVAVRPENLNVHSLANFSA